LSVNFRGFPQQNEASSRMAEKLETDFNRQVEYFYDLGAKYRDAQQLIAKLQKKRE